MKYFNIAVGVLAVGFGVTASAQTPQCNEPNVLLLFDVSGSMGRAQRTPPSKYDLAVEAIHTATQSTEADLRFGLQLFPEPGAYPVYCNLGTQLSVPLSLNNWDPIYRTISPTLFGGSTPNPEFFGGPGSDYDTPMYQALQAAASNSDFTDPARRHYVVLITDGVQDCCRGGDYDGEVDCDITEPYGSPDYHVPEEYDENRADLVTLVTSMAAAGVDTFVVGFGTGVDATTLDSLAQAGGTAVSGCTGNGSGDCYYQADDGAQLTAALQQITQLVQDEVCDGLDNDCDTFVDEDSDVACETACGSGFEVCQSGSLLACDAPAPQAEICDGADNNCDGTTDEGCGCVHGATQPCGTTDGVCELGTQSCDAGTWGPCTGGVQPGTEVCDGAGDEDCDNVVDEGCACTNGETRVCSTNEGECREGMETCTDGQWGPCDGGVLPAPLEDCDGVDNDCDGDTDEYCGCTDGETRACGSSVGACEPGFQECDNGTWLACTGATASTAETCNTVDDDCNGAVDDDAFCPAGGSCICGACMAPCDGGAICPGGGTCVRGFCITNPCPDGLVCDGTACVTPDPGGENTGGGGTSSGNGGIKIPPRGIDGGCSCSSGASSALVYGCALLLLLWRRRRR